MIHLSKSLPRADRSATLSFTAAAIGRRLKNREFSLSRSFSPRLAVGLLCVALFGSAGCISTMKYGDIAAIQPVSQSPRVGQVYLIRGLVGLFSAGIDQLTVQINDDGVDAHVYQEVQQKQMTAAIIQQYEHAPLREPLVLVGHSVGAEHVITIARELAGHDIDVDLMICMDATNPTTVPKNVKHCVNYYQSSILDHVPVLRGLPVQADADFKGVLENLNVRGEHKDLLEWDTNHFNMDKNGKIHADIIRRVNEICVQRASATTKPS